MNRTSQILLAVAALASSASGIEIFFSGRNLPSMDPFDGAPDALLYVYYAPNPTTPYTLVGRTDDHSDNRNPDWLEVFTFDYTGSALQRLKLDMYDADWPDADDYMGYVEVTLSEVVNTFGGIVTKDVIGGNPGGGQLQIKLKNRAKILPASSQ